MAQENKVEIFEEILATSKMAGFVDWTNQLNHINNSDPSWTWQEIKRNPWLAMAVYDDIEEKDARVGSCLETRKNAVLAKTWRIVPASDKRQDRRVAEFVEETLRDYFTCESAEADYSGFDAFLFEALDAMAKGVSIGEIIFGNGRDRVFIENVKFKPQQLFAFGDTAFASYSTASLAYPQTGALQLRQGVMIDMVAGGELPEDKFFVFSYRPRYGNRWGQALLKYVFWASWMKRASVRQWLRYQEKGSGAVIAKYPGGASEKERSNALDAATAIIEENAVAIPDRFVMEVHEMVRNLGSSHHELVDGFCNVEITLRLLGQLLTSRGSDGGGGSRALGEVHDKVRGEYTEADCKQVEIPVNKRIVKPIVLHNFGHNAKLPSFKIDYELEESVDSKAKRFGQIRKEIGIEMSKEQIREELQLDAPKDESDTLGGEAGESAKGQKGEEKTDALDAETLEFAEKKTLNYGDRSSLKMERFRKLRPSMMRFSDE